MLLLFIAFLPSLTCGTYVITVFGDVYKDKVFFTGTFPWIVDNIGGEVMVDFYMLGSGRYTVPQMCALTQLHSNTFLQAQYLKCEAEEYPSEYCLCESGIDPQKFKQCVLGGGSLAADASAKFAKLDVDVTPLIELGPRSTVFLVDDTWYLKKICTIFGDNLPRGCTKPSACNGTETLHPKRAIVQFDKCCSSNCHPYSSYTPHDEEVATEPYTTVDAGYYWH